MKREVTIEAATVEEALDAALDELGVQQDVVEYEVLTEPGRRLFGRSPDRSAEVRVWLKEEFLSEIEEDQRSSREEPGSDTGTPESEHGDGSGPVRGNKAPLSEEELDEVADAGIEAIEGLLRDLGVEGSVEEYEGDDAEIILDIVGPDLGILIGRHGKTLDAMQTIVTVLARCKLGRYHPILVDVEGYRSRRKVKLESIARNAADRASRNGKAVPLRPMNSYERKVIHVALRNDKRVKTASTGDEPYRAVTVMPR